MTYTRALIFDVETTGLLPRNFDINNLKLYPIENLPYVIQLSYMVYDFSLDKIVESYNAYVKCLNLGASNHEQKCERKSIENRNVAGVGHNDIYPLPL